MAGVAGAIFAVLWSTGSSLTRQQLVRDGAEDDHDRQELVKGAQAAIRQQLLHVINDVESPHVTEVNEGETIKT